jgi:predicted pyridoxine 5'-phosphate oxidase superfamily flavin-nucleotide-binding protein
MARNFAALMFSPEVKAEQERRGSRRQYERFERTGNAPDKLTAEEAAFIGERDSFYMGSVTSDGWPYVQHRGGPKGFLKVMDESTIAFADYGGNRQYISTGNFVTDDRVALIMVDYPKRERLKLLGRVEIFDGERAAEWIDRVRDPDYDAKIERVFVIHVQAFDWNCQQHITPRFTEEQIRELLEPLQQRVQALEKENQDLRARLSGS